MVRFLRSGVVLVLVTAGLYAAAMFVLCRVEQGGHALLYRTGDYYQYKGGVAYAKFKEWDPAAHVDVLVVGSSHAYRGYDPRVFRRHGISLFNLGSSAQTPLNTYHVLLHYAQPGHAGLVLIDVYEGSFSNDGLESTSELVVNMSSDAAALGMAAAQKDLRCLNILALRFLRRNDPPDRLDSTYVSGGFAEHPDSLAGAVDYPRYDPAKVRPAQVRYLHECLALCAERGLPAVLVTHCQPHQADSLGHLRFRALIDSVRAPFRVPYVDMALGHSLNDHDHFYDHNHLDQAGVELFNAALILRLRAEGLLPAHGTAR